MEPRSRSARNNVDGCLKGCLIGAGIFIAIVIGATLFTLNANDDEVETIPLVGEISLSNPGDCQEPRVRIKPSEGTWLDLTYDSVGSAPGRACRLVFDTDVTLADSYTIEVPGVGEQTFARSTVDTWNESGQKILEVRLSW